MQAMLFAAGLGTRLKPFTDKHPKALAEVNGKTLLEHNIRYLQSFGIRDVVVNVHHFAEQIEQVLANHHGFGSGVRISDERGEVLETGGGLKKARSFFTGNTPVVVLNVDVFSNLDLKQMIAAHEQENPLATLAVMQRNSSRQLLFDADMRLTGWENIKTKEKRMARPGVAYRPFAFSGVQIVSQQLLHSMPQEGKFSIIDVYLEAASRPYSKVLGYDHTGDWFIDVGKPESLAQAADYFNQ